MLTAAQTTENQLLAALPDEVYQRLLPNLEVVSLSLHQVIYKADELIQPLYFPHRSVVSLGSTMTHGETIEIGLVSRVGVVGVPALLGSPRQREQAVVQLADDATRIPLAPLRREFELGGALQKLLLGYVQAHLAQTAQRVGCNRLHAVEERLARWLLAVSDGSCSNELLYEQHT